MQHFDYKKVMQWLSNILKCPICGYKYNLSQSKVIDSEQNEISGGAKILIHSDCSKCKSSVMFNIEINGPEVFSVGVVTDLTVHDSSKFKKTLPISSNEVISIHKALKSFNGDFVKLIYEKKA